MRNKRILSFLVALVSLLTLLPAASAANDVYVGQTFYFGSYEQDGNLLNGDEPILWRVYSVDYGSRTVRAVSEYGLDSMVYNRSTSTTSWHNSTIRSWLNSTFLSSAFTSAEQGQLNSVYVSNSSDYVYILSQWEIQQYLDTELLYATEYARQCGAYTASDTGTSSYWARVDSTSTFGVFVGAHGSFYDHGNKVTEFDNAVRPAICVSFDVALGRWTPSSSDSSSVLLAMSNRPISTRSGPSTKYDELGTYWNDGGHTVTVLSRASGNDIWWLEVEFEYNGKMVRAYTGEQRIDIDVNRVPDESIPFGNGRVTSTTTAYSGRARTTSSISRRFPPARPARSWRGRTAMCAWSSSRPARTRFAAYGCRRTSSPSPTIEPRRASSPYAPEKGGSASLAESPFGLCFLPVPASAGQQQPVTDHARQQQTAGENQARHGAVLRHVLAAGNAASRVAGRQGV